jgi:4-cresol dehydrogenase (hydroxylating)
MTSVTHIANKARSQSSLLYGVTRYLEEACLFSPQKALAEAANALQRVAPNEWTSLGAITGNAAQVAAALKEIRQRIKPLARVMMVTDPLLNLGFWLTHTLRFIPWARANAAAISAIRPLHSLALGVPTDVAIDNLLWKFGQSELRATQLDQSRCGLLFISPALPPDGQLIARLIDGLNAVAAKHDHALYITVNVETQTSLVAVINLLFDKSQPAEVTRAHHCAEALWAYIRQAGLEVYRARVDMMADLVSHDTAYWQTVRAFKQVLDPDNIIAPGRYNLPE